MTEEKATEWTATHNRRPGETTSEEERATIEALRRRVAELEEENKSYAEAYDLEISLRRKYEAEATRLTAENAELKDRQKTLIEVFIHDPRQWDDKESGGTATVLACLLLEKVREFIKNYGHDPKGNVEDAFAAIIAENAELRRQVEALREDAEIGRSIVKLFSEGHSIFSEHGTPKIVKSGWWKEVRLEDAKLLIIEALRTVEGGE